jgi:hypothetical protein
VRLISSLGAILLIGLAAPSTAEMVPLPNAGAKAAFAFRETCLKSRSAGVDAAIASILAQPGVNEEASLPTYGGRKPMRTFAGGGREYLIRYGKKNRFGCFVAFKGDSELADSAKQIINRFEGLQPKAVKSGKKVFFEWTITGSKDEIRLTPSSDIGAILINLEVN